MYPPTALHFYNGMKKLVILTISYSTNFGNTFTKIMVVMFVCSIYFVNNMGLKAYMYSSQ